jgi:hypothetical protein
MPIAQEFIPKCFTLDPKPVRSNPTGLIFFRIFMFDLTSCTNVNWVFFMVGAGLFKLFAAFKVVSEPAPCIYRLAGNAAISEFDLTYCTIFNRQERNRVSDGKYRLRCQIFARNPVAEKSAISQFDRAPTNIATRTFLDAVKTLGIIPENFLHNLFSKTLFKTYGLNGNI